jgi:hypothetical protein
LKREEELRMRLNSQRYERGRGVHKPYILTEASEKRMNNSWKSSSRRGTFGVNALIKNPNSILGNFNNAQKQNSNRDQIGDRRRQGHIAFRRSVFVLRLLTSDHWKVVEAHA